MYTPLQSPKEVCSEESWALVSIQEDAKGVARLNRCPESYDGSS